MGLPEVALDECRGVLERHRPADPQHEMARAAVLLAIGDKGAGYRGRADQSLLAIRDAGLAAGHQAWTAGDGGDDLPVALPGRIEGLGVIRQQGAAAALADRPPDAWLSRPIEAEHTAYEPPVAMLRRLDHPPGAAYHAVG